MGQFHIKPKHGKPVKVEHKQSSPQVIIQEKLVEGPKETVYLTKEIEVPVEKIVYQQVEVPVIKEVIKEIEKRIEVPVEKIVEKEVIIEIPVITVQEKIIEVTKIMPLILIALLSLICGFMLGRH